MKFKKHETIDNSGVPLIYPPIGACNVQIKERAGRAEMRHRYFIQKLE